MMSSAFYSHSATLNNLGPGLGCCAGTYADVSDSGKWFIGIGECLFGRLESFHYLFVFAHFWRS